MPVNMCQLCTGSCALHRFLCTRAGSVSVFGVSIGIRYFRQYFFMSFRYSVSVSVTDPGLPCTRHSQWNNYKKTVAVSTSEYNMIRVNG